MTRKRSSGATSAAIPASTSLTPRERRIDLISQIEAHRKSQVIAYLTNTRPGLEVHMAQDVIRFVFELLVKFRDANGGKKVDQIDLFIHSNGGDSTVPWRLVTLIREFCKKFTVLVPYRAFSAATLTALGADEIVMHPMGTLGPTDATVTTPFNPSQHNGKPIGISGEDVAAYFQLVTDDVGIQHEDELIQAFNALSNSVSPLALGAVKRSLSQSRMMARKLLQLHMSSDHHHKLDGIVDSLTSKLFFHGHPINRVEAREQLQIPNVSDADPKLEHLMWALYKEFEELMELISPVDLLAQFSAELDVSTMPDGVVTFTNELSQIFAAVEGNELSFHNRDRYKLAGIKQGAGLNVSRFQLGTAWATNQS